MAAKSCDEQDVEAGREYVEAYVKYVHYVEGLYEAASNDMSGHLRADPEVEHGHTNSYEVTSPIKSRKT